MTASPRARAAAITTAIVVLTVLHYTAGHSHEGASPHHLYRRLYYFPILAAAWSWGARGGLGSALVVIVLYLPHAFGLLGAHIDPASTIDKVAEIVLYAGLGGLVGLFVDRERASSAELLRSQNVLVQAEHQAALGFLTAGLAHEIRNPLGAIRGAAELLEDENRDGPGARVAQVLVRETERLDGVLTRFLRFAGTEPSGREAANLSDIAEEVVQLITSEASHRGVGITHVRCSEMPTVLLDAGSLRQVLLNLVLNALQVQPQGGTVRIMSGRDDGDVKHPLFVRVEDAGPGVAAEDRGAIFHPYYSTRPGGTGLGLAISRRVVSKHNGTLTVGESKLGGASFVLRLPIGAPQSLESNDER